MNLKEFVAETLVQLADGVIEAQRTKRRELTLG
jgi:hypothetical protein